MSDQDDAGAGTSTPPPDGALSSLGDIRVAHLDLMRQASESEAQDLAVKRSPDAASENILPSADVIRGFLDKAKLAGASIGTESDRRAAQRILDYWSAELVARPAITKADITPARLAPYRNDDDEGQESVAADATSLSPTDTAPPSGSAVPPAEGELTAYEETERHRIRVAAQARQWANTGYAGYLLRGEALEHATKLPKGRDIDAFIQASIDAEAATQKRLDRTKNLLVAGFAILSAILAVVAVYAYLQAIEATDARRAAEAALEDTRRKADEIASLNGKLQSQIDETQQALLAAEDARMEAVAALEVALQKAEDATKKGTDAESLRNTLDSAVTLIADALILQRIQLDDVTQELGALALAQIAARVKSGTAILNFLPFQIQVAVAPLIEEVPSTLPPDLPGYAPDFLDLDVELPTLSADLEADTPEEPANYVNYSLVMSKSHRMAYFSAVNLDRQQRLVLQTAGGRLTRDTRILDSEQPDPRWYGSDWVPAQLASSADIAWGPTFAGAPDLAALRLSLYANVLPNSMPQSPGLAGGVWLQLENWVRNQHNPLANKVTIFTGPVFGPTPEGQAADAVPVPSAYWKVAVSTASTAIKGEARDPEMSVDAFLIPGDTTKTEFQPSDFRIPITELERLTGIDFGVLIEWTDSVSNPGPEGKTAADSLASRVGLLDSQVDTDRRAIRGELAAVLAGQGLPAAERRKVVAALTAMASPVSMLALSRDGRLNVLEALSWVPDGLWRRPDWLPLWSQARVAAADLEVREDSGATQIGQPTRIVLDQLERQLGFGPSVQDVYFQFAGMTRDAAEALTARMRAIGWAIPKPGEERVEAAAGKNEVRYNPDAVADRAAAELLAADLTAAGQPAEAKPVSIIYPDRLEIWVSI